MIDPLVIGLNKEYIATNDKKSENPTVWIIGCLDSFTQSKLISSFANFSIKEGVPMVEQKVLSEHPDFGIVRYGLKGFKNFGKVEFKTIRTTMFGQDIEVVDDSILKMIPLDIIHELASVIWRGNQVDEETRKN